MSKKQPKKANERVARGEWNSCRQAIIKAANAEDGETWKQFYGRCRRLNVLPSAASFQGFRQAVMNFGISKGRTIRWTDERRLAIGAIIKKQALISTRELVNEINRKLRWGMSFSSLDHQLRDNDNPIIREIREVRMAAHKQRAEELAALFPDYTKWERIRENPVTLCACPHLPFYSREAAERMIAESKAMGSKSLIIVGDIFEQKYFYPVSRKVDLTGAHIEKEHYAEPEQNFFSWMLLWFEKIYLILGNHDLRLVEKLLRTVKFGNLLVSYIPDPKDLGTRIIVCGNSPDKEYTWAELDNAGTKWLLTHAKSKSIIRGRNAGWLATKYDCNVISAHGHAYGQSRSDNGKYIAIDLGVLADINKISWLDIMKWPWWDEGFVILKDGKPAEFFESCVNKYALGGKD